MVQSKFEGQVPPDAGALHNQINLQSGARPELTLEILLDEIRLDNLQEVADFGVALGKEVLRCDTTS